MKRETSLIILKHRATYLGELEATAFHKHGALVLLIGLSGRIRLDFLGGPSIDCHSALIDAEVAHRLDPQGERIATIYSEVNAPETLLLRSLYLQNHPFAFDIIKPWMFLQHSERQILNFDLPSMFGLKLSSKPKVDPRVQQCIELLNSSIHLPIRQEEIASQIQLSTSRLNHLFKETTGVSYRRYRLWSQLAFFMRNVKTTKNLTASALNSGFFDASHLSNSYRKLFGISPASLLKDLDHFEIDMR